MSELNIVEYLERACEIAKKITETDGSDKNSWINFLIGYLEGGWKIANKFKEEERSE